MDYKKYFAQQHGPERGILCQNQALHVEIHTITCQPLHKFHQEVKMYVSTWIVACSRSHMTSTSHPVKIKKIASLGKITHHGPTLGVKFFSARSTSSPTCTKKPEFSIPPIKKTSLLISSTFGLGAFPPPTKKRKEDCRSRAAKWSFLWSSSIYAQETSPRIFWSVALSPLFFSVIIPWK